MDRRSFIGTLMAGLGALALKPPPGLLWEPTTEAVEVAASGAFLTLNQITTEMLRQITEQLQVTVPFREEASLLGHSVYPQPSLVLNHQYNVGMVAPNEIDRYGLDVERYIRPAAMALSERVRGVKGCGRLELPRGAEQACVMTHRESGLSIRGIRMFEGLPNLRFDMLVAS